VHLIVAAMALSSSGVSWVRLPTSVGSSGCQIELTGAKGEGTVKRGGSLD